MRNEESSQYDNHKEIPHDWRLIEEGDGPPLHLYYREKLSDRPAHLLCKKTNFTFLQLYLHSDIFYKKERRIKKYGSILDLDGTRMEGDFTGGKGIRSILNFNLGRVR